MIPDSIGEDDFKYHPLPGVAIADFLGAIERLLVGFAAGTGVPRHSIVHNHGALVEIALRIDQRKDYFHYFHSPKGRGKIAAMSQTKKLALLAYWIIRYKPFAQGSAEADRCYAKNKCTINELIALFILKIDVTSVPGVDYEKAMRFLYDPEVEKNMVHTFMHGDMTKESMILLFDSLERALAA